MTRPYPLPQGADAYHEIVWRCPQATAARYTQHYRTSAPTLTGHNRNCQLARAAYWASITDAITRNR